MKTLYPVPSEPSTDPAYLAAAAVHSLIQPLPSGTAFCIGIVLIVMMTGRLVQTKGSLARAVLPFVVHLRWGWHRVERAMERGTFSLDAMFDRAADWCLAHLPIEPVRLGREHREVNAIDSSTIARLRAGTRLALAGKGYCHRAGRAVRANIVAALTAVVMIQGVRVGRVRRTRFGPSCQDAVARVFDALPPTPGKRLLVVDARHCHQGAVCRGDRAGRLAGAPADQCQAAVCSSTPHGQARAAPCARRGDPSRARCARGGTGRGAHLPGEAGLIRLRRWHLLHYEECPTIQLDVVRIDDPAYDAPLLVGTTACELTSEECWVGYGHRWPVETNVFVAQDTTAIEMPRAWTDNSAGAADQFGLVSRVAVESHRGGLRAAGDGSVGSPARAFGGPPGELSGSPCVAFCGPCPRRSHTEKLSKKSKEFPEQGLAATEGCVNW